jgi:exopolysaccharide biosynthesis WecB/TagA/CpsF family protein
MNPAFRRFMGVDFLNQDRSGIRQLVRTAADGSYTYLVTPNVDDLVKTVGGGLPPAKAEAFLAADYKVCDSKILALLARLVGSPLVHYPGSDMVRNLLSDRLFSAVTIAVIGPSPAQFAELRSLYPDRRLVFMEAPMPLMPGSPEWDRCVGELLKAEWGVALICLPLPRQQLIAVELAQRGRASGIAMCVGASIDFLSGKQKRAPGWMRSAGLEWLFRLLMEPRRLWRRYLVDGPTIFPLFLKREVLPRLRRRTAE